MTSQNNSSAITLDAQDLQALRLAMDREPRLRKQFDFYHQIFQSVEVQSPGSMSTLTLCTVGGHAIEREILWCADCQQTQCGGCCRKLHEERLHLHNLLRWEDNVWRSFDLKELGIVVQLGHKAGTPCPYPCNKVEDFTVVHVDGIHHLSVSFCGCPTGPPMWIQSMQRLWVPNSNFPEGGVTYAAREWVRNQGDLYHVPEDAM
ncbi:hypothetical protein VKT23_017082 [Stygiomarasmius scandens]|uniref:CxC2-like cysteine cluster KDZ transposase-associated domain-containing protein n=1 Tax=Marasmiellus scandens TaxID=2682957 RepID=A0ABR1IT64_9AGAR